MWERRDSLRRAGGTLGALLLAALPASASAQRVVSQISVGGLYSCGANFPEAKVSRDGSRVVFNTMSRLLPEDPWYCSNDLYEWTPGGGLRLLTWRQGTDDDQNTHGPEAPFALSDDGSRVVYMTDQRLAPTDTDHNQEDLYALQGSSLEHLTDNPNGPDADKYVYTWRASGDASSVLVIGGDQFVPGHGGPYLWTPRHGWQTADPGQDGAFGDLQSILLSHDGSRLVFDTPFPLLPDDTIGSDVYSLSDAGVVARISNAPAPAPGMTPASSELDAISRDGRTVVFHTDWAFSAIDQNSSRDIYRANPDGSITLLSADPGVPHTKAMYPTVCGVSADGAVVAFIVSDSLSPEDTDDTADIYVWRREGGLEVVSQTDALPGSGYWMCGNGVSEDGSGPSSTRRTACSDRTTTRPTTSMCGRSAGSCSTSPTAPAPTSRSTRASTPPRPMAGTSSSARPRP